MSNVSDTVLDAVEKWWNESTKYGRGEDSDPSAGERDAFAAGAEWQRERDACVVEQAMVDDGSNEVYGYAVASKIRGEDA